MFSHYSKSSFSPFIPARLTGKTRGGFRLPDFPETEKKKPSSKEAITKLKGDVEALKKLKANADAALAVVAEWQGKYVKRREDWKKVNKAMQKATGMTPAEIQKAVGAGMDERIGPETMALIAARLKGTASEKERNQPKIRVRIGQAIIDTETEGNPEALAGLEDVEYEIKKKHEYLAACEREIARNEGNVRQYPSQAKHFQPELDKARAGKKRAQVALAKLEKRKAQLELEGHGTEWVKKKKQGEVRTAREERTELNRSLAGYRRELPALQYRANVVNNPNAKERLEAKKAQIAETERGIRFLDTTITRLEGEIERLG